MEVIWPNCRRPVEVFVVAGDLPPFEWLARLRMGFITSYEGSASPPPSPGKLTFPVIRRHVESILPVSESEIRATMRFLLERLKILVEPSGAVAVAAVLFGMLPPEIESAGVVISGGNVDLDFFKTL
jgi:threonine synthase